MLRVQHHLALLAPQIKAANERSSDSDDKKSSSPHAGRVLAASATRGLGGTDKVDDLVSQIMTALEVVWTEKTIERDMWIRPFVDANAWVANNGGVSVTTTTSNAAFLVAPPSAAAAGSGGNAPTAPAATASSSSSSAPLHQFCFFLKPEATAQPAGVKVRPLLKFVLEFMKSNGISIGATIVLSGAYLQKWMLMDKHYGVINDISRRGAQALSAEAHAALQKKFQKEIEAGYKVIGGHQLLAESPFLTPVALTLLCDNMGTTKLGPGAYGIALNIFGSRYVVLNAFHPFQLTHFTAPGQSIVVFECVAACSWATLRQKVIGATNPGACAG